MTSHDKMLPFPSHRSTSPERMNTLGRSFASQSVGQRAPSQHPPAFHPASSCQVVKQKMHQGDGFWHGNQHNNHQHIIAAISASLSASATAHSTQHRPPTGSPAASPPPRRQRVEDGPRGLPKGRHRGDEHLLVRRVRPPAAHPARQAQPQSQSKSRLGGEKEPRLTITLYPSPPLRTHPHTHTPT